MSEPSMVCNGHKESNIEKCSVNTVSDLFSAFEKNNADSVTAENTNKIDSMTIGTIPFPDFDHLYASSVEETGDTNTMNLNIARCNINSYHLNLIEEQAKIIDAQNLEISKLKKQNESLIARIERMNRRLNLNQYNRRSVSRRSRYPCRQSTNTNDRLDSQSTSNCVNPNDMREEPLDDSFPDDIPLIKLTPFGKQNDSSDTKSINDDINHMADTDGFEDAMQKQEDSGPISNDQKSDSRVPNNENMKANFRNKFRNSIPLNNDRRKRNKMVRFAEENKLFLQNSDGRSPKRNCAKTVDEQLITDDAVLFLKTHPEQETPKPTESVEDVQSEQNVKKKKSLKIPILVTNEPYFATVREDICQDPVTYTPTSLEVPSFRTIEKDNVDPPDVPKDYFEDVRIEAAKERHLRFEVGERKRKKWDVQRIRELRQNERLKEKLRRRKSRWYKMDSPKQLKTEIPEQVITLFPDIKSIEKIIITNAVPVTALGTSIPKVPSWGNEFDTQWLNDGTKDTELYEDIQLTPHHKDVKSKPV